VEPRTLRGFLLRCDTPSCTAFEIGNISAARVLPSYDSGFDGLSDKLNVPNVKQGI
jgi:hypothetical protein